MKRLMSIMLAAVTAFALTACGSTQSTGTTSSGTSSNAGTSSESSSEGTKESSSSSSSGKGGKTLVVYYSASGNTKAVAEKIASDTDADTFVITPEKPYTDDDLDWTNDKSRVSREHNDTSLQDKVKLKSTDVPDWDSYSTVFIGYPIWWGIAAWPVNQFVTSNDFSGKEVIPFCTSVSSDIGSSGTDLGKKAGSGEWQTGKRFPGGASDSEVSDWVKGLDF